MVILYMTNLNITLNRANSIPLQVQLISALKDHIATVSTLDDVRLPSSRSLAIDLNVSRIVTLTAYEQLIAEGYLISKPGSGTYINQEIFQTVPPSQPTENDYRGPDWFNSPPVQENHIQYDVDFTIGRPSNALFDEAAWKRSWRHALSHRFSNEPPPPEGIFPLRQAIAELVVRNRGIRCVADDIIITSGAVDIITLMARLTAPFNPISCLENPGFPAAWEIFNRYGHDIRPVTLAPDGLRVSDLPVTSDRAKLLFCTPSHQFPLGYRLPLSKRLSVLDWAVQHDAIILEDDYDSEFRYDVASIPSLKAQDSSGHVIYFSSLSKSLSPAIRLGYMIAPQKIRSAVMIEIDKNHMQPTGLLQRAMAHFIQKGELDKHIRRMRRLYGTLNAAMRDGLAPLSPKIRISGLEAGLHCALTIPSDIDIPVLQKKLKKKAIKCSPLDQYSFATTPVAGLALGYGHLTEQEITSGLAILCNVIKDY